MKSPLKEELMPETLLKSNVHQEKMKSEVCVCDPRRDECYDAGMVLCFGGLEESRLDVGDYVTASKTIGVEGEVFAVSR